MIRAQLALDQKELRLIYLVIFSEYRRQGFGATTLELLIGALIRSITNDIVAEKMTLIVREKNSPAFQLFSRAGFQEKANRQLTLLDPLSKMESIGRAVYMEYVP